MISANTSNSATKNQAYYDFGTKYEVLLLQQRKLYEYFLGTNENIKDDDGNNKRKKNTKISRVGTAAILANHAAILGMLQSAIYSLNQREKSKKTNDEIEDLKVLQEHTFYQQNYDHDFHITKRHEKRKSFGLLCSMAAFEDCDYLEESSLTSSTGVESASCGLEDVDGFFKDYPECERKDVLWENLEDDQDNHDDYYSCETRKFQAGLNDAVGLSAHEKSIQRSKSSHFMSSTTEEARDTNCRKGNKATNIAFEPHNQSVIYGKTDLPNLNELRGRSGVEISALNTGNYNNGRVGGVVTGHTAFEENSKKNPFCTAREFKHQHDEEIQFNDNNYNCENTKKMLEKNNAVSKDTVRIQTTTFPVQPVPFHNPNRPTLSAGLKRKFQLPKARNGAINSSSRVKGEGGQIPRHLSEEKEEDDPLPEELKGLDKELIAKIENEIVDSGEPITFQDIAGLENAKQTVLELVCWPMKRPDLFTGLRRGPNGLLLFGPPGTGKTLIGKAIAHESGATFFSISSSSLTSKWIGEGEKLVRTLFAVAAYREPAVVFIDEIDSLLTQRKSDENEASRRIKTEFLVQLDGTGTSERGRVLVIGATNRPHELDDAARRRFVKRLYIPLPERADREILLKTLLKKNENDISDKEYAKLSLDTKGFSGADLKALCTDAALGPIRQLGIRALKVDAKDVPPISYRHFRQALKGMRPSVAQSDLDIYVEWNITYGSKSVSVEDDAMSEDETDLCILSNNKVN